jgi:hypothetical protein
MLGKVVIASIRLTDVNFKPCPYKLLSLMDKSKKLKDQPNMKM